MADQDRRAALGGAPLREAAASIPLYPAIDIHSHFDHGSPFEEQEGAAPRELSRKDLGFLRGEYRRLGVRFAGMSTFASVLSHPECILEENEYLARLVEDSPWMRQWAVADPRQPDTLRQAGELLASPRCLGIKIHPQDHGYDIEEYADVLFSFAAERRAAVLMHPAKIARMPLYADRYPEMKLIIAHLGSLEHVDAIRTARYGNILTDTSGVASSRNQVLEYAVRTAGADRILFGTDTYSCAFQYGRVLLADLPEEDRRKILYGNAVRLFPDAFQD